MSLALALTVAGFAIMVISVFFPNEKWQAVILMLGCAVETGGLFLDGGAVQMIAGIVICAMGILNAVRVAVETRATKRAKGQK